MKTSTFTSLAIPTLLLLALLAAPIVMTRMQPKPQPRPVLPVITLPTITVQATPIEIADTVHPAITPRVVRTHRAPAVVAMPYYSFGAAGPVADKG